MNELEKKVNALVRICTEQDDAAVGTARQELDMLLKKEQRRGSAAGVLTGTRRILRELGVPEHLSGYQYLVEAVVLVIREPAYLRRVTTELYPAVAKKCGSTASRVERAIRHAIETAWTRCTLDTIARYFGNTISPTRGKPVNSEFIARVSSAVLLGE